MLFLMRAGLSFLLIATTAPLHSQSLWSIYNTNNSNLPDNVIRAIEEDTAGNIWVGTDNGLAKFDGNNWTVLDSSNSGLPVNQIRSLGFDSANRLWVGTLQAGLAIYDYSSWIYYNSTNSQLPDDQVRTISFDKDKAAWIGTSGGVVFMNPEGWAIYNMNNSVLDANNINRIFIDEQNIKWIGTVNGGISKKDGNTWTTYNNHNSGLTDNTVLDIESDIWGNIWFATPAQGLGRYNGSTWFYRLDANSNIPTNSLTTLELVKSTDVKYIGTTNSGLIRWNNGLAFDSFTVNNCPVPDNNITCLKRARDSRLWMGTATGGVAVFNDTTHFALASGIEDIVSTNNVLVYPNPVNDRLFVTNSSVENISLFTYEGREIPVDVRRIHAGFEVNTSSLSQGVYLLRCRVEGNEICRRIIK
jgi:ligand-binding sensor domain-containing protein